PVVVNRRPFTCRDGVTRLVAGARDWSHLISDSPRRTSDRARYCRICDDLCRRSLRAPATKRASRRNAGATAPKKEAEAMAWFYLFLAGLFEVAWAIGLSEGFSRLFSSFRCRNGAEPGGHSSAWDLSCSRRPITT